MQIERQPGEQMRGFDRREMDADRADGKPLVGAAHHIHGDGVGIGGQRFPAECAAPTLKTAPGRAIGPAGAVALGAGGIERGAAREVFQFRGAAGAVRHAKRAEQTGLQDQRSGRKRILGDAGRWRLRRGGRGEGVWPRGARDRRGGLRPRCAPQSGQTRSNRMAGSLRANNSVRKGGLADTIAAAPFTPAKRHEMADSGLSSLLHAIG
jgi:hypothetical protein